MLSDAMGPMKSDLNPIISVIPSAPRAGSISKEMERTMNEGCEFLLLRLGLQLNFNLVSFQQMMGNLNQRQKQELRKLYAFLTDELPTM